MRLVILALLAGCLAESEFEDQVECHWAEARDYNDFYADEVPGLEDAVAGTLLRVEHVVDINGLVVGWLGDGPVGRGAHVYRILYRTEVRGEAAVGSARVAVPMGEPPDGGFDVVVHGHSTVGVADRCAPSRTSLTLGFETPLQPLAARMVALGYLVVAPDYPGLGTPGPHGYMIKDDTGRDMLDAARAVGELCDASRSVVRPPSGRMVLEGHSQGGFAVLAAHELWQRGYARELELLGTLALNPAAELRMQIELLVKPGAAEVPALLALNAYLQWYDDLGVAADWLEEPWASDLQPGAERECIARMTSYLNRPIEELVHPAVVEALEQADWGALAPLGERLDENTPGGFHSSVPVFLGRGSSDWLIHRQISAGLRKRLCGCGTPVDFEVVEGANHYSLPRRQADTSVAWMIERFHGLPAAGNCLEEVPLDCPLDGALELPRERFGGSP